MTAAMQPDKNVLPTWLAASQKRRQSPTFNEPSARRAQTASPFPAPEDEYDGGREPMTRASCFMPGSSYFEPVTDGPLSGLSFAAKANIDIAGAVTANGSPAWAASHDPATSHAPMVEALLAAGAALVGTAICDELCFSINGENVHFGTPLNAWAPDRIPGGSSSGSASAVAGVHVDFALGTDTSGSVRIPASYCGVFGLRGSHGLIPASGIIPLARSFDTPGWFSRDPTTLNSVGEVLWDDQTIKAVEWPRRVLIPSEVLDLCDPDVVRAFHRFVPKLISALGASKPEGIRLGDLGAWRENLRAVQAREVWAEHRDWIDRHPASFGPGMEHRLRWGERISDASYEAGIQARSEITRLIESFLQPGTILVMPTAPGPAPRLGTVSASQRQVEFRDRAVSLVSIASLAGVPELSMPLLSAEGCPVGLSMIGARQQDAALALAAEGIGMELDIEFRDN